MGYSSSNGSLIEQAREELEILEFQHPNRFHCLKMELKSFIADLESHNMLQTDNGTSMVNFADTQESTNMKKRKKIDGHGSIKRRGKTEAVLERAQQCLHKIQHFKTNFYV